MMGQGAFSLTVNNVAGSLATAVGADLSTVTNLTVTGTIDARDFKTMRDNMTAIAEIDLSGATIVDYSGTLGTSTNTTVYPANEIPSESFYMGKSQKLSLTKITLPNALSSIGNSAFYGCLNLTNITIPETVTTINARAFQSCNSFTDIVIPNGVTVINANILYDCSGLLSLTIGNAVTSIKTWAFGCSNLKTFNCLTTTPPTVDKDWFNGKSINDVFVPTDAAVTAFRANYDWITAFPGTIIKKVGTIGGPFLSVSATALQVSSAANSSTTFTITSNTSWTITSDQSVCVVSPTSGSNNGTITVTATTANTENSSRTANLTITGVGVATIVISATQAAASIPTPVSKTVNVTTAGTLSYLLTDTEKSSVTNLTVTGNIDIRDFGTLNSMPLLAVIDISFASIVAFSTAYPANQLPGVAFVNGATGKGKTTLKTIALPTGMTSIGDNAFMNCTGLTAINFPAGLDSIGGASFYGCTSITSLTFPTALKKIKDGAFSGCTGIIGAVTFPTALTSIGYGPYSGCSGITDFIVPETNQFFSTINGVLFNKNQTKIIQYPAGKTGAYTVPNSVINIGNSAFYYCTGITAITLSNMLTTIEIRAFTGCTGIANTLILPATLTSIGGAAFGACTGIKTIYSLNPTPPTIGGNCFAATQDGTIVITDVFVPTDAAVTAYKANTTWIGIFPGTIIKKGAPSAVPTLTNSNVKVYPTQSAIIVEGTTLGETVSVYNLVGVQLQTVQSKGDRLILAVRDNGIYLVKTTSKTVKVVL